MRVTIGEVALHAGVSKTTVSRVLNSKGDVDEKTARRVRDVIDRLGYVPSARAVGLAIGRTNTVGMLVPSLGWPWISQIVQGVAETLEAHKYGLLLYTCTRGKSSLDQFAASVAANSCDGLVVVVPEGGLGRIEELHRRGLPMVMIDDRGAAAPTPDQSATDAPTADPIPVIGCTNSEGAASAALHLLELGRTRPVVVTGPLEYGCVQDRLTGFRGVFDHAGHELTADRVIVGDFTIDSGRAAIGALARTGAVFDAVFAMNDLAAIGVIDGLRPLGRRVPEDVSVVGFDDIASSEHANPPLTTVRQPMLEMGLTAGRMLLDALAGIPLPAERTVIDTTLVVRASTVAARQDVAVSA